MELIGVLLIAAAVFGVCWLLDKGFVAIFRNKVQHRSGLAVRANKRYAVVGLVLGILGITAIIRGILESVGLLIGGILVLLIGGGLIVYYLSFGVFYDQDSLLLTIFGKKDAVWQFRDIQGQKLYLVQGGSVVVELHMADGRTVNIQTGNMEGAYPFLDHAFYAWCRQKGLDPEACEFHDPANSIWFPAVEDI